MKNIKKIVTVTNVEYRNTSYYGNPSNWITFIDENGTEETGYTSPDAACGYGCSNYLNKPCVIEYHYTMAGNCVINFMNKPR